MGLFSSSNLDTVLEQILQCTDIQQYECDTILTSISLPILLNLRRLSIWIALNEKFPKNFSSSNFISLIILTRDKSKFYLFTAEPPDASIKDVIKLILNPKICEKLNKTFEINQCGMMINLFFEHSEESDELRPLWDVKPEVFNERYATPR